MDLTTPIDITAIQGTADKIKPKIKKLMMQNIRSVLATLASIKGIQSSIDMLTFIEGNLAMPYDPTLQNWQKLGDIKKRTANVKVGMVPIKDEIERYRDTYLIALEELNLSEAKLPFAQWYLETIVGVGLQSLFILPYQGVHNAAGTSAIDIADGFFKIIEDEKTANNITVALGNLYELSGAATDYTSANIGTELKAQYFNFPEVTQQLATVEIRIPYRYREMYKEWWKSEYPTNIGGDVPTDYLDGTDKKAKFIWESAMGASKKVIMNVPGVMTYETDNDNKEFGKMKVFHPDNNPFYVACVNKIVIGFQIHTLDKRVFSVNNL
ncbi:MAG: hypothetical protein P1P88_01190 [Bacteroidales bacterium]|nr:hypothetical protein [Bacteroidales bacterium]